MRILGVFLLVWCLPTHKSGTTKVTRDLSNPDKVHLDKGTSKEEVALPDVAGEVEDHLRRL